MNRIARSLLAVVLLSGVVVALPAGAGAPCRVLVLGAMPVEIGPFLAEATATNRVDIETTNDRGQQQLKSYFLGTIAGKDVIMAMTGIGTKNAEETAQLAFDHLGCISGAVFSGVSGGTEGQYIGDVFVPESWTLEVLGPDGEPVASTYPADEGMLDAARAAAPGVTLSKKGYIGDIGCVGVDPYATPTIDFPHAPTITVGDWLTGRSADPFGGHALPCVPGTDTFGCNPCRYPQSSSGDIARTVTTARPFATPDFFTWYQKWAGAGGSFNVQDMESAAVAKVAKDRAPFIAFRSPSDGGQTDGDPLPPVPGPFGFLSQFMLYRQYAADNAAAVALAFLAVWTP